MLKINNQQIEVFETQSMRVFIKKTVIFLRQHAVEFTKDKKNNEIEKFIIEMIQFAKEHKIKIESNVQNLMLLKIKHHFNYTLPSKLKYSLAGSSFSEEYRLRKFSHKLISKNDLKVIDLDDDI